MALSSVENARAPSPHRRGPEPMTLLKRTAASQAVRDGECMVMGIAEASNADVQMATKARV